MTETSARDRQRQDLADEIIRDLRNAQYGDELLKTRALVHAAERMVDLRSLFTNKKGDPDWAGRAWDYRQMTTDIYNSAGLDPAPNSNVKAALRYHISRVLRERLSEDELEAAGLLKKSARDRAGLRYRADGDEAEFMHGIYLHMLRTPMQPLPAAHRKRAKANARRLVNWLNSLPE